MDKLMVALVTDADLLALPDGRPESTNHLPYLYSPFDGGARFRCAGMASPRSVAIVEARDPGSVVLPRYCGDQLTRNEVLLAPRTAAADYPKQPAI